MRYERRGMVRMFCGLLLLCFWGGESPAGSATDMPEGARRLSQAYPEAELRFETDATGAYLVGGETRFLYSPLGGCPAAGANAPADPPLCATLSQAYPAGPEGRYPEKSFEPGRVRNEAFLKMLYGDDAAAVDAQCVEVPFLGETVRFSSRHGAAAALGRVAEKLERVLGEHPEWKIYIHPVPGGFFWRTISRTHRLSAHSFGIAIDLNPGKGPYWQWQSKAAAEEARRDYPQPIVAAFESEGFIWGGKWHAYDFMHFEYRPELFERQ